MKTTTATAQQNSDGTWKLTVDGKVQRKRSKKFFPVAYSYEFPAGGKYNCDMIGKVRVYFAPNSQLRRLGWIETTTPVEVA